MHSSAESLLLALRAERDACRTLQHLLEQEQSALNGADPDLLLALAQRKSEQVAQLARLGAARNRELSALVGLTDQAGIERFGELDAVAGRVAWELWQELLDAARAARRLNEENGAVIALRLQHSQQALAILRGAAQQVAEAYGPDGQPCGHNLGRPLGKA